MKYVIVKMVIGLLVLGGLVMSGGPSMEQMRKDQVMTALSQAGHSDEFIDSLSDMQIIRGDKKFVWVSDDRRLAQLLCIDSCTVDTLFDLRRGK